jgi:RNA methyltransferase, TrmH family
VLSVSGTVLAAMTPVRAPSGIVAIVRRTPPTIGAICSARDAFVLAVEDVQDPGNLGSLLRAAEAGGATGALICGASATPFSVKAVRGSMGSVLRMPVLGGLDTMAAMTAIDASGLRTIASVARGGEDPEAVDWTGRVALWIGSEGQGLSEATAAACNARVTIPMEAPVESLNVAVAGAILVYAARRQRASQRT